MSSNEMTVEQARAKLGDLVIAAMRGETTVITRYGKPAAYLIPIPQERAMTITLDDIINRIHDAVTANGAELREGIDTEAAAQEIRDTYGLVDVDTIPADEFWAIVAKHDATQQS